MPNLPKDHEEFIANLYGGKRSASSGASITDKGDVTSHPTNTLFECKMTGQPGHIRKTTLTRRMEKIADEAWEVGMEPALALRFFNPNSPLSNREGWVDLTVRLSADDARSRNHGY